MTPLLLQAVAVLLLIAIFGVAVANHVLHHERLKLPEKVKRKPEQKPQDGYALDWWQDLGEMGLEVHLANGETYLGHTYAAWCRYPDGKHYIDVLPSKHWDLLSNIKKRIEWKEPEVMTRQGSSLLDWTRTEAGYQLRLRNGSVWEIGDDEVVWRRLPGSGPDRYEPLVKIHAALNDHLVLLKRQYLFPDTDLTFE